MRAAGGRAHHLLRVLEHLSAAAARGGGAVPGAGQPPGAAERLVDAVVPQALQATGRRFPGYLADVGCSAGDRPDRFAVLRHGCRFLGVPDAEPCRGGPPHRCRASFSPRYARVVVMLGALLLGRAGRLVPSPWWPPRCPASRGCSARRRSPARRWSSSRCCCSPPGCCSCGPHRSRRCGRAPSWARRW